MFSLCIFIAARSVSSFTSPLSFVIARKYDVLLVGASYNCSLGSALTLIRWFIYYLCHIAFSQATFWKLTKFF